MARSGVPQQAHLDLRVPDLDAGSAKAAELGAEQFHLDVTVDDVDAAEAAALKLGVTSLSSGGVNWRVYADPAGKPFCLCWA